MQLQLFWAGNLKLQLAHHPINTMMDRWRDNNCGQVQKPFWGVKSLNWHMMDVFLDTMVAYSIILHSIVSYYIIHTIVDQQWCGVMQIALPFLPHPCHHCTNIINLTCTTKRCQQSTTCISPQVCGHWSCKLAHYLLITCGKAGCQSDFFLSQQFNWNSPPLTSHFLSPPVSMHYKTYAPHRAHLRHQSNH